MFRGGTHFVKNATRIATNAQSILRNQSLKMQSHFFYVLSQKPAAENYIQLLDQLWWEWALAIESYSRNIKIAHSSSVEMYIVYFQELGTMLDLFLKHLNEQCKTYPCKTAFLGRHQPLSRCLDFYDTVVTPQYIRRQTNTIQLIQKASQRLLTLYDENHPHSASSASLATDKGPGTTVTTDTILSL